MKRNAMAWFILSAIIMLFLPWLAVTFIKGDGGMAACLALFFGINPIYSVITGTFAGKNSRQLWYLPIVSPVLFLLGTWLFFDLGETAFLLYMTAYLALGILAMLLSAFVNKKTINNTSNAPPHFIPSHPLLPKSPFCYKINEKRRSHENPSARSSNPHYTNITKRRT